MTRTMIQRGPLGAPGWLLIAATLMIGGCNKGEAERLSCRTDQDCIDQSLPASLKCLAVTSGETLNDFCRKDSRFCPFHRHAPTMYAMPRVCDIDRNGDGLADVYLVDRYQPVYHANGSLNAGELGISNLFQANCGGAPGMAVATQDLPFEGLCVPEGVLERQPLGDPCLSDSQCESTLCASELGELGLCVDGEEFSTCIRDDDCRMGICLANSCSNGSPGSGCRNNSNCNDGIPCLNNICSAGGLGQSCHFDEDCQDGAICAESVCSTGTDGAPCLDENQCLDLVDCIEGRCDPVSDSAVRGACSQGQGLGVLQHDSETDVTFDGIRPEQGGPTCGTGARNINLQRVVFFELPGPARLDVSYQAPGAERIFIRSDCSRPSSLELCEQVNGDASQFSKRLVLDPGRYSIHISAGGAAPDVDYLRLRAVYDDPADGGGESHGTRLRTGTCEDAPGVEPGIFSGNTDEAPRLHVGGEPCAMSVGPETVLRYDAMRDARLCISTEGSNYDTVLYVRGGSCQDGGQLACNDDRIGQQSQLEFDTFFGTTYFIFVDTFGSGAGGEYHLSITDGACPRD